MPSKSGGGGGGILDGLSTLVEKLAELAESGERLQKKGKISSSDEKVKGAYDVDIRVGLGGAGRREGEGDRGPAVEPVGKAREERERPRATVQPIREPPVDIFEEETGLLVVAQLPGVECSEIVLELRGDILAIQAEHDDLKYQKELLLPRTFSKDQMRASCRNEVLEVRMTDTDGGAK